MPAQAPSTTQGPQEPDTSSRGTKRAAEDAGDAAPEVKRSCISRLPSVYVTRDYEDPEERYAPTVRLVGPEAEALEKLHKAFNYKPPRPMYLISRGNPPRRINSGSTIAELSEEYERIIPEVRRGAVVTTDLFRAAREHSSGVSTSETKPPVEPASCETSAEGRDTHDAVLNLDLDVTMTDAEGCSSPSVIDASASQLGAGPAAGPAMAVCTSPSNEPAKPEPVKAMPPSPIVAFDETSPQPRLEKGTPDDRPRIPSVRTWRRPGPSPLRQTTTPAVPIPVRPVDLPPLHPRPTPSSRGYQSETPRPPVRDRVKKITRDLRVASALRPQLLKRRAFAWSSRLRNISRYRWPGGVHEFKIVLLLQLAEYVRGRDMRMGKPVPARSCIQCPERITPHYANMITDEVYEIAITLAAQAQMIVYMV
ncbi:hypothetical protein K466DRAFT_561495 [Polyporus arcularius HHB13444]|uniref:Uncharacterized protein n=1 Tax=Polyporus arcularius HHB13444 TaxID=1314778 RepID=A0A5C3PVI4_9APHY|nr:hypothetical protein K466DRAFT_561495 [Polyporus arcularius HHB13444]